MRERSEAELYFEDVAEGRIVACRKMVLLAQKMLPRFADGYKGWRFDIDAARRPVEFVERFCKVPSGKLGKQLLLQPFQKARFETAFGFVDCEGRRQFQEVLTVEGRKNGKSSETAALELHMLIGDKEGAPQVYNVANSESQAKLAYNAAIRILRQSKPLQRYAHKRANDVYCRHNLGYIMPLTSQTRNLDGLDVHFGVIDELSAIRNRDLYDLIKQGMGAREQPMLWIISTNGFVRDGIFDAQYDYAARWLMDELEDDRFLPFVYELDDRDEWDREECWIKANPGLGTIKKVEYLRDQVAKAKQDPTYKPTVMVKEFNMPENQATAWLTFEEAVNEESFDVSEMGFRYGIVGFDAADTIDLNAAKMMLMRPGDDKIYEIGMYWLPEDAIDRYLDSGDRKGRDFVPYEQWIARGLMRTVPGNKVDKRIFLEWMEEIERELGIMAFAVGFDPWRIDDSTRRDLEAFVGKGNATPVRQGAITLSQPMKQFKADLAAKRIVYNRNPIDEWCRMNVSVKSDVNGNIQPYKKELKPQNRIDGFMAEICAYVTLCNRYEDYRQML